MGTAHHAGAGAQARAAATRSHVQSHATPNMAASGERMYSDLWLMNTCWAVLVFEDRTENRQRGMRKRISLDQRQASGGEIGSVVTLKQRRGP